MLAYISRIIRIAEDMAVTIIEAMTTIMEITIAIATDIVVMDIMEEDTVVMDIMVEDIINLY